MKLSEATQLKIHEMRSDINAVGDETKRANLNHSFEKVLNFIDEDLGQLPEKVEELKSNLNWSDRVSQHLQKVKNLNEDLLRHLCKLCPSAWRLEFDFTVIGAETEDCPLGYRLVCHNDTDDNLTVEHEDFNVAVLDMIRLFITDHVYPLG